MYLTKDEAQSIAFYVLQRINVSGLGVELLAGDPQTKVLLGEIAEMIMRAQKERPGAGVLNTKHNSCCLENAGDTEPIFVLRATDLTAPTLLAKWTQMNRPNMSVEKCESAHALLLQFYEWQRSNPTKVKRPD